jgi:hypothetical protein
MMDWISKWASTLTVGLASALIIGGLNLHGDVRAMATELASNVVLAQSTEKRETQVEAGLAGVRENLEGLRRDIDKLGDAVKDQAEESAKDRALILQELGRLQGAAAKDRSR